MRYIPTLLLLFGFIAANSQQANTVTMLGIGEVKIGMTKEELESVSKKPIQLRNLLQKENWERDTVKVVVNEVVYEVVLDRDYMSEKSRGFIVHEVSSRSANLKTRSGIKIGDDKLDIVRKYSDYQMHIMPEYDLSGEKSKTRSLVMLHGDNSSTMIVFYLTNNKVTGFGVMYNEGC